MLTTFVSGVYLFLYVPIIILVLFSFNDSAFPYFWKGWTLRWYRELWASPEVWDALQNSLVVAVSAAFLSLTLGLLAVLYGARTWLSRCFVLFYTTLAIPEIVLAVGLLSFFSLLLGLFWAYNAYCGSYAYGTWVCGTAYPCTAY